MPVCPCVKQNDTKRNGMKWKKIFCVCCFDWFKWFAFPFVSRIHSWGVYHKKWIFLLFSCRSLASHKLDPKMHTKYNLQFVCKLNKTRFDLFECLLLLTVLCSWILFLHWWMGEWVLCALFLIEIDTHTTNPNINTRYTTVCCTKIFLGCAR